MSLPLKTTLTPPALPTHTNTSSLPFHVCDCPALSVPSKLRWPSTSTCSQASWLILAVSSAPPAGVGAGLGAAALGAAAAAGALGCGVGLGGMGVGVGTLAAA